jgi:hypothetical protein
MEPVLDRLDGDAQDLGRLGPRQSLHIAQYKGRPERLGQFSNGSIHLLASLSSEQLVVGYR